MFTRPLFLADSLAFFRSPGEQPVLDFLRKRALGIDIVHLTSASPFIDDFDGVLAYHDSFVEQALGRNLNMRRLSTRNDAAMRDDRTGILFGLQHLPKAMTLENMRTLRLHGLNALSLAYEGPNEYGHGFTDPMSRLTARGEEVLTWMAECGILLDLSHAGHGTARGALAFIKSAKLFMRPMISHSGCYAVFPHKRNVPDDILKDVADLDGYIGIPCITFLLGPKGCGYFAAFKKHLAHAKNVAGEERVGIGSDSTYRDMTIEEAYEQYQKMNKMLGAKEKFEAYFPDRPTEIIENGSRLFEILMKNGCIDEKDIDGVCGTNFRKYLYRVLPK